MSDLAKLAVLYIRKCPDLVELSNLAHLSCLERITIVKCKKLRRVSGMSGLAKLVVVNINQCSELVELSHLAGLNCLKSIKIDRCGKLKSFELNGCKILRTVSGMRHLNGFSILNIHDCPQLEMLPLLQGPSCLESITINGCSQLNCLELNYFANLKTISGMLDLAKLVKLDIRVCPELEELPILAHLSCLESITIIRCEKLHYITLPATLSFLKVKGCTQLKTVPGIANLKNLVTLFFLQCPELVLEELSSLARLSCLERITIDSCKKLHNITGIEELQGLRYLQLSLANNVALRNCIYRLQSVPSEFMAAVGSAGDGAESAFNSDLFSDVIGGDTVSEIDTLKIRPSYFSLSLNSLEIKPDRGSLSAIIICAVIMIDGSTSRESIDKDLRHNYWSEQFHMDGGEWIVTIVITDQERIDRYIDHPDLKEVTINTNPRGIMKKGIVAMVKKGEEGKILHVLKTIIDQLHGK